MLVGTVAYQCYSAVLGTRLDAVAMQTGDADFAQFHEISVAVGDSMPPILEVLRRVDPTFREVRAKATDGFPPSSSQGTTSRWNSSRQTSGPTIRQGSQTQCQRWAGRRRSHYASSTS
nr:GSU2403 family nucleotidyltransferase fold protein [Bradyrhizobium hereditatis]